MLPRLGGTAGLGGLTSVLLGELSISCDDEEVDDMDVERKEDEEALVLSKVVAAGFGKVEDDDDDET